MLQSGRREDVQTMDDALDVFANEGLIEGSDAHMKAAENPWTDFLLERHEGSADRSTVAFEVA